MAELRDSLTLKVAVTFSPSPTVAGPAGSTERDSTDGGVTSDNTRGVHTTTSPLIGTLRDFGVFAGAGGALCFQPSVTLPSCRGVGQLLVRAVVGLGGLSLTRRGLASLVHVPSGPELQLSHTLVFALYSLYGFLIVRGFPFLFRLVEPGKQSSKSQ